MASERGVPSSPASRIFGSTRPRPEELGFQVAGSLFSSSFAKDCLFIAIRIQEVAHVLDDSKHGHVRFRACAPLWRLRRRQLRGRHDDRYRSRVRSGQPTAVHRSRAWREIDNHDFKLAPLHVIDELANGFLIIGPLQNNRGFLVYEEAHGHDANAMVLERMTISSISGR